MKVFFKLGGLLILILFLLGKCSTSNDLDVSVGIQNNELELTYNGDALLTNVSISVEDYTYLYGVANPILIPHETVHYYKEDISNKWGTIKNLNSIHRIKIYATEAASGESKEFEYNL